MQYTIAEITHFLVTGDVAFFYDRNAFWHNYPYTNLKIILLNNKGGSIFRMIEGPKEQPELEEFFETEQKLNAKHLCKEFNIEYTLVSQTADLKEACTLFLGHKKSALLEIQSDSKTNQRIFESFKKHIQN